MAFDTRVYSHTFKAGNSFHGRSVSRPDMSSSDRLDSSGFFSPIHMLSRRKFVRVLASREPHCPLKLDPRPDGLLYEAERTRHTMSTALNDFL